MLAEDPHPGAPAAAARQWTNRLGVMVLLAAAFGALSGAGGTFRIRATGFAGETQQSVVATFKRLLGPDSQAQSSYKGVIGSVRKIGRNAVREAVAERMPLLGSAGRA